MKVVLLKDIQKIGRKFEVKDVADGYALNFLLPQKAAELATPGALKKVEERKKQADQERQVQEEILAKNFESIKDISITIDEKGNEKGHLFAALHKEKIAEEVKKQTQIDILPEFIVLEKPIKEAGEYDIHVEVKDKKASFKLVVNSI